MTNLKGGRFGSWKLFDEIREKEQQKEDNSGREKIKVKEDKGERNVQLRKKKKKVKGCLSGMCPCKEVYKMKFSIVLGHNKLSQNFHNS